MKNKFIKHLRQNLTTPESILWYHLRNRRLKNYKFRRQMPIKNYIVDFVCLEKMLIIEIDGGQHAERKAYDSARTIKLNQLGFHVLRFWNDEVLMNLYEVLQCIVYHLEKNN